jgi:spore coat protein CotH
MKIKKSLFIVMLVGIMVFALAGCGQASGQAEDEDSAPFYDDRVVTVRIVMSEEDWEYMQANAMAEQYAQADLWYDGELIPAVAVRPKGNSSLMSAAGSGTARFSLKVDLNFFNAARNLYGVKKLNFNNGFSDPTFIREVLGYELFEQTGIPTPRTSFVDLWVNDTHLGLYTMVEQIDKTFLSDHFADNTGNLYKPEMPAAYLNWTEADLETQPTSDDNQDINLGGGKLREIMEALEEQEPTEEDAATENPQMPFGGMPEGGMPPEGMPEGGEFPGDMPFGEMPEGEMPPEDIPQRDEAQGGMMGGGMPFGQQGDYLEQMGLKTNENSPDHSALFRLLDVLNNEPDETFPEEIEKVLDVDGALRFLAVSALIVHLDNYIGMGHNYYLYEVDGKFTIIPWDLNMAFGTFNSGLDRDGIINFYIDEPTAGAVAERPLVRLLSVPAYLESYHRYLEELLEGPFSEEVINARIDELADMIRPYVEADELKFYSTEEFETGLSADISGDGQRGMGMTPIGLKTFIAERAESVRQQLSGERPSSSGDGSGNGGSGSFGGGGGFPARQGQ